MLELILKIAAMIATGVVSLAVPEVVSRVSTRRPKIFDYHDLLEEAEKARAAGADAASVQLAFSCIEIMLDQILDNNEGETDFTKKIKYAQQVGVVSDDVAAELKRLSGIRARVIHPRPNQVKIGTTPEDAASFIDRVRRALLDIEHAEIELQYKPT
ncbi:hypothetical protein C1X59_19235 [Pseudomonas sp. FW215-R2]|uniref:hypothetical protein n=1 Tax=unclassified Pseudomonas TaxID=196821 RepID=UPI000C883932|nr:MULTISPECIES: hypothetical protein [unclassified Pseudomonas]PMW98974.1 hypothetical protein C1X59_19235 [Pseudomonas sp. FW215-R2]PMX04665.1 hypothetical protein C1X60_29890 [Pseudomonas sp. FW215-L1]PMX15238.1 hypothetical protein C1X57_29975 [Pseudomonas sp. FW215-E1]PNA20229.1 hypothetical protein C1X58_29955 [Pseudomonas sp. FW215-R4]